jgi:YVTN family beta-propeller protein
MRHLLGGHRVVALAGVLALSGFWASTAQASDSLAYVANEGAGTITSVDLTTGTLGTPISVGPQPEAIAITPNGSTAYVADHGSSKIVPVNLPTGTAGTPIALHDPPTSIAITPDGTTAYVISDNGTVCPIPLATGNVGTCKYLASNSDAIAIAPSGSVGYVTNVADATISPLTLPDAGLGKAIDLTSPTPDAIAITPDGSTAYVASNLDGTITPIDLATRVAGTAITAGTQPSGIAITPDGLTAYVTDYGSSSLTPITLATGTAGTPLSLGFQPSAIALVPVGGGTSGSGSGSGSGGSGSGSGSSSGPPPTTIGNQKLTLTLSAPAGGRTAGARMCRAPRSTLRATLKRRMLRVGLKLRFHYVTFTLGKHVKRAKRLPATVKLSLRGLRPGFHTLTVKVFYLETLTAHASGRRQRHKLTVTITKKLTTRIKIC